jgi:hypothetical protein
MALVAAAADVEEELVAVAQLDQPAGRGLLRSRARHPRPQGHDAHLVGSEIFARRVVDVPIGDGPGGRMRRGDEHQHEPAAQEAREIDRGQALHRNSLPDVSKERRV